MDSNNAFLFVCLFFTIEHVTTMTTNMIVCTANLLCSHELNHPSHFLLCFRIWDMCLSYSLQSPRRLDENQRALTMKSNMKDSWMTRHQPGALQKTGLFITTVHNLFVEEAHLSLTLPQFLYGADIFLDGSGMTWQQYDLVFLNFSSFFKCAWNETYFLGSVL